MYKNKIIHCNSDNLANYISHDSIDVVVTSPPYDNLRDYDGFSFDAKAIIDNLYKVMKKGGVVVWVVGDATVKGSETGTSFRQALAFIDRGFLLHDTMIYEKNTSSFPARKNAKRYTQIFEYMFVFSKDIPPKTANLIIDKQNKWAGYTNWGTKTDRSKDGTLIEKKDFKPVEELSARNNIWRYVVGGKFGQKDIKAYKHPATFPEQLVADHLNTWSNPGDLVLDPMCGSGTTCKIAKELGRDFIGADISRTYAELAAERCNCEVIEIEDARYNSPIH